MIAQVMSQMTQNEVAFIVGVAMFGGLLVGLDLGLYIAGKCHD